MTEPSKQTTSPEAVTMSKAELGTLMADVASKAATEAVSTFKAEAEKATNGMHATVVGGAQKVYATPAGEKKKGINFARVLRAYLVNSKNPQAIPAFLKNTYGPDCNGLDDVMAKTLAAGNGSLGGFLVPGEVSNELIELLRPAVSVRRAGPTVMPIKGTLELPRQTGTANGTYVGENSNMNKSNPQFGIIKMTEKKLASLVPISNDLLRNASIAADEVVRNDLVASLGVTMDAEFIRGDGLGNGPKGMRYWALSNNVITANGTVNLANVTNDLGKLELALMGGNVDVSSAAYFMAPRTFQYLFNLRDGNGNLAFPEIAASFKASVTEGPTTYLRGYPLYVTTNIPVNVGTGGNKSEVYFVAMRHAVIADAEGVAIDASDTAAYFDGSNLVASFSQDQTVIRAIARHDFAMRQDNAVAVLVDVAWAP